MGGTHRSGGRWAVGLVVVVGLAPGPGSPAGAAADDAPAALAERAEPGLRTRLRATLEADGRYLPGEGTDAQPVVPRELTVRTRIEAVDQVLDVGPDGRPRRLWRRVEAAEVVIGGEEPIRPQTIRLRPEVGGLLVARSELGLPTVASPAGPLTRAELDLLLVPADPIELLGLLPDGPVRTGDSWDLPDPVARALSGYDTLASNRLRATLRELGDDQARIELTGTIEGAALGGLGTMRVEGEARFDRRAGRLASATIARDERRKPGPVEAGLEFRSTIRVERLDAPEPPAPAAAPPRIPERIPEDWLTLAYVAPDGGYRLEHDRAWHVFSEDPRQAVLRRVEGGTVTAQVNLVAGPALEPGARPDAERFRNDVRKALGDRFERVIDAGQVAAPDGEFRYRLALAGTQADEPIVWYYYLIAAPDGRQLVAIVTLRASETERLGRRDQRMIGSLRWLAPPP